MKELEQFLQRAEAVLARVERLLPEPVAEVDWNASTAFRWRVPRDGRGYLQPVRNPDYKEEDGQRVMKQSEITVRVTLARGKASATVWTCDLSHDYVSINADYRS